jgi:hypothetical protein
LLSPQLLSEILVDLGFESTIFLGHLLLIALLELLLLSLVILMLMVKLLIRVYAILSHIHANLGRVLIDFRLKMLKVITIPWKNWFFPKRWNFCEAGPKGHRFSATHSCSPKSFSTRLADNSIHYRPRCISG